MRQDLIDITHEMEQILIKLGQAFRANAYKKAATSLEKNGYRNYNTKRS